MNKESKLNLNACDYAISHCDSDKTYNGLEVHKKLCDAYIAGNNDTLEDDDERIKNSLINLIKMSNAVGGYALHKWEADEMLAWIERQGELPICNIPSRDIILAIWDLGNEWKELTNGSISTEYGTQLNYIQKHWHESEYYLREKQNEKNKLKFKVGDWIVDKSGLTQQVLDFRGGIYTCTYNSFTIDCESNYHFWALEDAKDGDVLQLGEVTAIFQKYIGDGNCKCYCSVYDGEFEIPSKDSSYGCHNAIPAIKEQRDTLLKAMADAGYTFDFERKELKRIVQKPEENKGNLGGISPTWSEEDEKNLRRAIRATKVVYPVAADWLKSLKDRVQPKQEWSEEDEEILRTILSDGIRGAELDMLQVNWLKSLRPQNHWKPNDEQIKVCKKVYADILSAKGFDLGTVNSELNRLEEELKKKGE